MKNKNIKWTWKIILLGGLFMIYGGILDVLVYFEKTLPFAPPSWHSVDAKISLICGIFVLTGALYLILKSFEIKSVINKGEINKGEMVKLRPLIKSLLIVCIIGTIIDFIAGYYARGFLLSILGLMQLDYTTEKKNKIQYLCASSIIVAIILIGFILTGGK